MKIEFHHLNVCSMRQPEVDTFYRDMFGLVEAGHDDTRFGLEAYPGKTSFITDGRVEFHVSETDNLVGFRTGHAVNPLDRGHIAFRTDDLDEFKAMLKDRSIQYSDYGICWMNNWDQIYFYDPAGNVIEVHQVREDAS